MNSGRKIDFLVPVAGVTYKLGPLNMDQVGDIETLLHEGALIPIEPNEYVLLTGSVTVSDRVFDDGS